MVATKHIDANTPMNRLLPENFRVICAWCKAQIRAPKMGVHEAPESHGVCRQCAIQMGLPPHLIVD